MLDLLRRPVTLAVEVAIGLVLVLLAPTLGCSAPLDLGFAVATTLHFDASVDDASLAQIKRLAFDSDEPYETWLKLDRALGRTERTVYRPLAKTRSLTLKIQALDGDGKIVATGAGLVPMLTGDATAELDVLMSTGLDLDLGAPDTAFPLDLTGSDLSGSDLLLPVGCSGVSGAFLCEDFEASLPSFWDAPSSKGATVSIDASRARSGARALHIQLPSTASITENIGATIENVQPFVGFPATGDVWVSAHYYFKNAIADGSFFFIFQQWNSPFHWITLSGSNNHPRLDSDLSQATLTSARTIPTGKWTCLTMHIVRQTTGSASYLIDGVEASDISASGPFNPTPTFGRIRLGYQLNNPPTSSTTGNEIWIDDVRIDTSPITCTD